MLPFMADICDACSFCAQGNDASEEEQPYSKDRDSQEHSEKHKGGSGVKGARRRIVNAARAHKVHFRTLIIPALTWMNMPDQHVAWPP